MGFFLLCEIYESKRVMKKHKFTYLNIFFLVLLTNALKDELTLA